MHYYSEKDIRDIVVSVVSEAMQTADAPQKQKEKTTAQTEQQPIPVEVSARHVHLTREAVEKLFGKGYTLTKKRDLSQPGEFLSEERVKIVTNKGEFSNVAVLGPERSAVQVELSMTDTKTLGLHAPINLSGNLTGADDVILISKTGMYNATGTVIVAKAHIHMTPMDAAVFGVRDRQSIRVRLESARPVTLDDVIIRVKDTFKLAMHIDFDEANAAAISGEAQGFIVHER